MTERLVNQNIYDEITQGKKLQHMWILKLSFLCTIFIFFFFLFPLASWPSLTRLWKTLSLYFFAIFVLSLFFYNTHLYLASEVLSQPDFRYWEDASDEYRQLEGSLLPLWRFSCEKSRSLVVSALSWNPARQDLFAASYTPGKTPKKEVAGNER